jgi:glycosyltransferase involved in cell wall biosynthesis
MKIALYDPNLYKFTQAMQDHWEAQGHEFRKTLYYDPAIANWADTLWFDTCDNNMKQATMNNDPGWKLMDMPEKKHVICRVIDIEAWCGLYRDVDWYQVDDVIFIAPHIRRLVENDVNFVANNVRVHDIPCGVDTDKFTYKQSFKDPTDIAWVAERWDAKGITLALQLIASLPEKYTLHACGIWVLPNWYKAYVDHFIKENNLEHRFLVTERVEDMNAFLEDMDYTLCASKKEAFSYAIAEGMSKGLKPLIHNFYGAPELWDRKYIWNTIDQARDLVLGEYNPEEYRKYILDNYTLTKMLNSFDKIIERKV